MAQLRYRLPKYVGRLRRNRALADKVTALIAEGVPGEDIRIMRLGRWWMVGTLDDWQPPHTARDPRTGLAILPTFINERL